MESKHFFYASSFIALMAATAYFAMASGAGRITQHSILNVLAKVVYGFILLHNQSVLDHIEETGDTHRVTTEGIPGTVKVMP